MLLQLYADPDIKESFYHLDGEFKQNSFEKRIGSKEQTSWYALSIFQHLAGFMFVAFAITLYTTHRNASRKYRIRATIQDDSELLKKWDWK